MLQYKAVVERSGSGEARLRIQPGLTLHEGVEIGKIERHRVRCAEDDPVEILLLGGRDLEERVAVAGAIQQPLGREIKARIEHEADRDEEERGFAETFS